MVRSARWRGSERGSQKVRWRCREAGNWKLKRRRWWPTIRKSTVAHEAGLSQLFTGNGELQASGLHAATTHATTCCLCNGLEQAHEEHWQRASRDAASKLAADGFVCVPLAGKSQAASGTAHNREVNLGLQYGLGASVAGRGKLKRPHKMAQSTYQ